MRTLHALLLCVLFVLYGSCATPLQAQVATGTPRFGSFAGGPDIIDLGNLNAHITIPIFHRGGRGIDFDYSLYYDSAIWDPSSGTWSPRGGWGWTNSFSTVGYLVYKGTITVGTCTMTNGRPGRTTTGTYYWTYLDGTGSPHSFPVPTGTYSNGCTGQNSQSGFTNQVTPDGSGYSFTATGTSYTKLVSTAGSLINVPVNSQAGAATLQDRNGNQVTESSGGLFTDTLGTTALTVAGSGTPASPVTLKYTAPSGALATFQLIYITYTIQTNFGCGTVTEYGANGTTTANLLSEIDLPDGSKYLLSYETTPNDAHTPHFVTGRLASIQLPTGGTISYGFSGGNNGINCADGSTATLTRTATPDGTWIYARSQVSGSHWQTQVTSPANDATVLHFQQNGIYSYETQRLTYQGTTAGTLLQTQTTCYNGNTANCPATAITLPITQRNITSQFGSSGFQVLQIYKYNSYGLPTEEDDYDFASGTPTTVLRQTLTTYASLGNGIVDMPATVTVKTGGGATLAQTTYTYDQGTPTVTSAPQHISITGSRGNLTTVASLVSGLTTLNKTFTYYDTGTINTSTDVNGQPTSPVYANATSSCGFAFPTSVNEPLSLSKSFVWNCAGGVLTSITDENSKSTSISYNDAYFWRPYQVTDSSGAVTTYTYPTSSPFNWVESSLPIVSASSAADVLTTFDGLGRVHLQQTRQQPGLNSFDTVETDYDSLGRASKVTVPFNAAAGGTNASAPGTSTQYDALNRVLQVTDGGGGYTQYAYSPSNSDVVATAGPNPTGENLKKRQLEYDGLGRLTSVCEMTSASGSGSCAQQTTQTGYWTKYVFDALGDLTGMTQNAQASAGSQQTRSYSFDGLGRMISETNPEIGPSSGPVAVTYAYDSASGCTGTYNGDLVKKVDPQGTTICLTYDALHRNTSVTYSGGYASVTSTKTFVYDTATVNGVSMTNAKGRLAEAYTGSSGSKITDLGFSYSARGEVSDTYESTPHSSGYYHVTQTYWPHGSPSALSATYNGAAITGLPTIYYGASAGAGLDGEGRLTQVTASSGQNPVTGVNYSLYSSPPQMTVTLGSGDSDLFNYDANTLRMTKYQFNVGTGGQSDSGTLTWNANSTLQKLVVSNAFNSTDNQTCTYGYDDLVRIASASCGAVQAYSYSYDPFGNVSKIGNPGLSFQPVYSSPPRNQISTVGGLSASYDSNGNVLNDRVHTYTWDANGKAISVDSVSATYDAEDRMVEQNRSGTYTEIVYSPTGAKLALMNGATLQKAFLALPGKAVAIYTSAGLDHYRHSDWLGSARLTSSPSRAFIGSAAYAPHGETYASSGTLDVSFTGQNQDTTTPASANGDYDFLYREYNTQGRWASPDPAGLAAVSLAFPQTLNRYAYVGNSPLTATDPLGLVCRADTMTQASFCNKLGAEGGGGGSGDNGDYFDLNGLMGMGDVQYGYDMFDAIAGAPGTYTSVGPGGLKWGFSIDKWQSDVAQSSIGYSFVGGDDSKLEKQKELAAIQLGQRACRTESASGIAACIQEIYDSLVVADVGPDRNGLIGGNFNFYYLGLQVQGRPLDASELGDCALGRCGAIDSLHFHTDGYLSGTFHVDTANPFTFLGVGALIHGTIDVLGGHTWWSGGIPRNP